MGPKSETRSTTMSKQSHRSSWNIPDAPSQAPLSSKKRSQDTLFVFPFLTAPRPYPTAPRNGRRE